MNIIQTLKGLQDYIISLEAFLKESQELCNEERKKHKDTRLELKETNNELKGLEEIRKRQTAHIETLTEEVEELRERNPNDELIEENSGLLRLLESERKRTGEYRALNKNQSRQISNLDAGVKHLKEMVQFKENERSALINLASERYQEVSELKKKNDELIKKNLELLKKTETLDYRICGKDEWIKELKERVECLRISEYKIQEQNERLSSQLESFKRLCKAANDRALEAETLVNRIRKVCDIDTVLG